ncbi:MAG: nuclear transport factor 2 family protein [Pyrinomonadaceae bacterium]
MILNSRYLPLILTATVVFSAWAAPAGNAPAKNANVAKPVAAAPTADALLALEKQANEAYIKGDGKFFESFLSDKLVMQKGGSRLSKTDVVKMISGVKCDVKEGRALTEPQMLKIDNDAYVLSYESNMKGSCTADGKTEKMPSPVRAATVWVRNGDKWQAVFHGENLIVDPTAPPANDKEEKPKKDDKAAANANTAAAPAPAKPTADPITDALMAAENSVWEAWRTHDAKKIEDLTAKDIAFVNIFGTYFANKIATTKNWTSAACEVKSFTLTDGVGTSVSPTVGILTLTGTVNGTCSGKDISGQKIYGNSVYVKDGDAWKWVFGFNSPS